MNLADIAILSRNSYYLKIMETELIKHNIPLVACITDKIGDNIKNILEPNKVAVTTIHKSKG
jgi:ATP-dependent exoDNAse (exonuclease V) beta subunit